MPFSLVDLHARSKREKEFEKEPNKYNQKYKMKSKKNFFNQHKIQIYININLFILSQNKFEYNLWLFLNLQYS